MFRAITRSNLNSAFLGVLICAAALSCSTASPIKAAKDPYYLTVESLKTIHVGPPVALGSAQDQLDVKAVKAAQSARTSEDCKRAQAEAVTVPPSYQEMFGEVGPFPAPLSGEAKAFLIHVWSDLSIVSDGIKQEYKWPRVFTVDSSIEPCVKKTPSPAFPSGHTVNSRVLALVLSEIEPGKRGVYLKRADEVAQDRVIAGVHRPSEIAAGKALADQIFAGMMKAEEFRRDLAKVKALVQK